MEILLELLPYTSVVIVMCWSVIVCFYPRKRLLIILIACVAVITQISATYFQQKSSPPSKEDISCIVDYSKTQIIDIITREIHENSQPIEYNRIKDIAEKRGITVSKLIKDLDRSFRVSEENSSQLAGIT